MSWILLIGAIGFFLWLYTSSEYLKKTPKKHPMSFEDVLYSEYGYAVALIAKLAKADGKVSELEAELISNILDDISEAFSDPLVAREHLKVIFNEEKDIQDNVSFVASEYFNKTRNEGYKQLKVLEFLISLAFIDGFLHPREKETIETIARAFFIDQETLADLLSQFDYYYEQKKNSTRQSSKDYYSVLGIASSCSDKELKDAYRKAVKTYHPDVVTGKGGSESDIQAANAKLQEINEAYEMIKKIRLS